MVPLVRRAVPVEAEWLKLVLASHEMMSCPAVIHSHTHHGAVQREMLEQLTMHGEHISRSQPQTPQSQLPTPQLCHHFQRILPLSSLVGKNSRVGITPLSHHRT